MANQTVFYVGGYAAPGERGVLKCALDGGGFHPLAANDELANPSWVLPHPTRPILYAVEELPEGRLAALPDTGDGLRRAASLPTLGADPCHLCLTPDGRHLLAANYTGGSLAVFALDADGLPTAMTDLRRHTMDGPLPGGNPVRQESPHIHFSLCDGERVYLCDLGMNRVFVYGWDGARGRLTDPAEVLEFPAGSGPRHLTFSADGQRLYVLCELDASIHVFRRDGSGWQRAQAVSCAEAGADFERFTWSAGAAIRFAPDGGLWASVRGADTLVGFRVDGDGQLAERRILPAGGRTPRDFLPVEAGLLAADQDSDRVTLIRPDGTAGPSMSARRPTCLARGRAI